MDLLPTYCLRKKHCQMKNVCCSPPWGVLLRGTHLRCLNLANSGPVAAFITASLRNENCMDQSCRLGCLSSAQPHGSLACSGFCPHHASSPTPRLSQCCSFCIVLRAQVSVSTGGLHVLLIHLLPSRQTGSCQTIQQGLLHPSTQMINDD